MIREKSRKLTNYLQKESSGRDRSAEKGSSHVLRGGKNVALLMLKIYTRKLTPKRT